MATILAHITVRAGHEARFEDIAHELHDATHASETGVLRYEYWRGAEPRTYYTLLSFNDFQTFIEHQVSDHHETASPAIGEVCETVRLEWVDPMTQASPLPPTEQQDPPAGASDLALKYSKRYEPQIADWWLSLR